MDPTTLKIYLLQKGLRQVDLAREYGCTQAAVNKFINGSHRSRGLGHFIAGKLDLDVVDLLNIHEKAVTV